jgi:hypothetical protein
VNPGRHYVCQAEKLLVACFVGRYVFLPRDCEVEACKTDALHKRLADIKGGVIAVGGEGEGEGEGEGRGSARVSGDGEESATACVDVGYAGGGPRRRELSRL